MISEQKLTEMFRKHLLKKYGLNTDYFKDHSTSFQIQGEPDIKVSIPWIIPTLYIEAKKCLNIKDSLRELRPTQVGRIQALIRANRHVFILFNGGIAKMRNNRDIEILFLDENKKLFSGFDNCVEHLFGCPKQPYYTCLRK